MSDNQHDNDGETSQGLAPDYEVGYGRPPKDRQFRPGQSGNTRGRPKGARSFKTDLMEVLKTPVEVTEGGKSKRISTQRASLLRLKEKALKGNERALDRLLAYAAQYNAEEVGEANTISLLAEDREILENALERQRASADTPPETEQ